MSQPVTRYFLHHMIVSNLCQNGNAHHGWGWYLGCNWSPYSPLCIELSHWCCIGRSQCQLSHPQTKMPNALVWTDIVYGKPCYPVALRRTQRKCHFRQSRPCRRESDRRPCRRHCDWAPRWGWPWHLPGGRQVCVCRHQRLRPMRQ